MAGKSFEFHDFSMSMQFEEFPQPSEKVAFQLQLVGGLEHEFYDFPFSWECHHPN